MLIAIDVLSGGMTTGNESFLSTRVSPGVLFLNFYVIVLSARRRWVSGRELVGVGGGYGGVTSLSISSFPSSLFFNKGNLGLAEGFWQGREFAVHSTASVNSSRSFLADETVLLPTIRVRLRDSGATTVVFFST